MQIFVLTNWNTSLGMLLKHFKGAFLWFFGLSKGESTNPTLQMTQTKIYFLLKLSHVSGLKFINSSWSDPSPLSVFCASVEPEALCAEGGRPKQRQPGWSRRLVTGLVLTHNPLSRILGSGLIWTSLCSFHSHIASSHAGPILEGHVESFKPVAIRWYNFSL